LSKGAAGTEDEECDQGQFHCGYEAPGDKGAIAGPKYQGGNKGLEAVFESKCNILRTCGNWPWASGFCESVQGGGSSIYLLDTYFNCGLLHDMAEEKEKSRSKDILLWVITVALIALAIYWYKR
jgi:hypothetical protein